MDLPKARESFTGGGREDYRNRDLQWQQTRSIMPGKQAILCKLWSHSDHASIQFWQRQKARVGVIAAFAAYACWV